MSTQCFICDERVGNDKVHLATGIAPHSKLGLPAKISNLIGDAYVVVVCQSDNICRRCSALINHMDKLETELAYVKSAITQYIRVKYNLPLDEDAKNAVVNGDVSPAKKNIKKLPQPQIKQSPVVPAPVVSKPTPAAVSNVPQEDTPKLKIYKCGFCSFQSKDLNSVRLHMRVHIKTKPDEVKKASAPATPAPVTPPAQAPSLVRKKLFRCQVCSASFVDRKSCLQHIKLAHSKASNKENEQQGELQRQEEPMDTEPPAEAPDSQGTLNTQDEPMEGAGEAAQSENQGNDENLGESSQDETQASQGEEESQDSQDAQPSSEQTEGVNEGDETSTTQTTAEQEEEQNKNQPGGEQRDDLDIEAMIAALHSETSTSNSENIAISL